MALPSQAQNNAYGLDDECYPYFRRAEDLVGKAGFNMEFLPAVWWAR